MASSPSQLARELAKRLRLDRPLTLLDLEATGPLPEVDRIVEFAALTVYPQGRVVRFQTLVHPGIPIPAAASEVHGIKDQDVEGAPSFRQLSSRLYRALNGRDVAGYNLRRYDLRLLAAEFRRCGLAYDVNSVRVVDAMKIFHLNERRDLDAAVRFYLDRSHQGHRADADIDATIGVLCEQLRRYDLPDSVDDLDEYCRNRQPDWLTQDGRIVWRNGRPCLTFGRYAGSALQLLAEEQPEYLQWILENEFAPDVKALVEDALKGRFPKPSTKDR